MMKPNADGKIALLLAFVIWMIFGATISTRDLEIYTLQQAGVEAIVEYQTFSLGHSRLPQLREIGDIIYFDGKTLAAKQPGQFALGAIPYFFLHLFGFTYEQNYTLVSALVTFFSTSLFSALAAGAFFLILSRFWNMPQIHSGIATALMALGTTLLPYSGVAHHDVLASSFLIFAFYFIERNRHENLPARSSSGWIPFLAGCSLSLALFMSMLASSGVLCLGLYFFSRAWRSRSSAVAFLVGAVIGSLPLVAYNTHYFGNPLLQSNIAGEVKDTLFGFKRARLDHHLRFYLLGGDMALFKYMPIAGLGFFGFWLLERSFWRQIILVYTMILLHFAYLLNIETVGHCQYGPRYLIPLIPFLMVGISGFFTFSFPNRLFVWLIRTPVYLVGGFSILINLIGALGGTVYCDLNQFGAWRYWQTKELFTFTHLPLAPLCTGLLAAWVLVMTGKNLPAIKRLTHVR